MDYMWSQIVLVEFNKKTHTHTVQKIMNNILVKRSSTIICTKIKMKYDKFRIS